MDCGGDTAYVFIAMIVLSDENGIIKHTAESLARAICKDPDSVRSALENLERQDLKSNLKAHGGRRIVPLYEIFEDETRGWLVVNKEHYRDKVDPKERRDYMREYMRKYRKGDVNNSKHQVNSGKPDLAHTDTDTDTDKDIRARFAHFWSCYPRKTAKQDALKAFTKLAPDHELAAKILAAVEIAKRSAAWLQDDGKFIPHAATWINGRRWEDETAATQPVGEVI